MKSFSLIVKAVLIASVCVLVIVLMPRKKGSNKIRFVSLAWQEQSLIANKEIIRQWNQLHPDKQVEYIQANWSAIYDYLLTSFETGDVPDVFQYEASMLHDFGRRGNLTDLRPYLSDSLKNDIYPQAWESVTLDNGRIIGVPFLFESLIVLYNKEIFEKNDIKLPDREHPWSWNDLKDAAVKLTKDTNGDGEPDRYGAAIGLKSSANIIINLTLGCGGEYFYKSGGSYAVRVGKPETRLLTTIHDMIYKYKCISPLAVSSSGSSIIPSFYSGKFAMLIGIGTWGRQQIVENAPESFRWGVLEPVREVTAHQGSNTQTLSITAGSKRKKDSAEFIEFFLSRQNMKKLALSDWMNPCRISCRKMPEFNDENTGWATCISMIDNLRMGPWLSVPGFSEWKGRVANPVFQEYFSGRMSLPELKERIESESEYVLSRYKNRK